jgi:hypothetical protein
MRIDRHRRRMDGYRPLERRAGLERRQILAKLPRHFAVGAQDELEFGGEMREVVANLVAIDGNWRIGPRD